MVQFNSSTDSILKIISITVYLIFICSVTYDYAYLWALGLNYSQIPISFSDIINSAFIWTPTITIVIAIGIFTELLFQRIEQGKTEDEIIQSMPNPTFTRRIRQSPYIVIKIISIIGIIFFIIFGQQCSYNGAAFSAFFIFFLFWSWFGVKLSDAPRIRQRRNIILQLSILLLPIIITLFLALGYDDAISQTSSVNVTSSITLNNNDKLSAKILRNLDKGLLYKDVIKNEISFLSWLDIKKIDMPYQKKLFYKGFLSKCKS